MPAFKDVIYGEVDCKYKGCDKMLSLFELDSKDDPSLDNYQFNPGDFPMLVLTSHGAGYILKGEDLGTKVDKILHSLMQLANGKNMDDFTDKLDMTKDFIHLKDRRSLF